MRAARTEYQALARRYGARGDGGQERFRDEAMEDTELTHGAVPSDMPAQPSQEEDALSGLLQGRARVSRRMALVVAAAVVLVLALGWAVDSLGTLAPAVHFSNGAAQQAGLYRVALTLDPSTPHAFAAQRYTIRVTDTTGHAVSGAQVQLTLAMATMDMPAIHLAAAPLGSGAYTAEGALTMPGEWHAEVTLTLPSGGSVHTQFDIAAR